MYLIYVHFACFQFATEIIKIWQELVFFFRMSHLMILKPACYIQYSQRALITNNTFKIRKYTKAASNTYKPKLNLILSVFVQAIFYSDTYSTSNQSFFNFFQLHTPFTTSRLILEACSLTDGTQSLNIIPTNRNRTHNYRDNSQTCTARRRSY